MSKANKLTVEVGTLAPKSVFEYGGVNWIVLQRIGGGILCLAEKILFNKAFDKSNNNNWEDSTLREFLNNKFLECITKAQERFINNGSIELDAITRAIQTVNAYKDGLPL